METGKLMTASERIIEVWEDLNGAFLESGEKDQNKFIAKIIGYDAKDKKTRLHMIRQTLQEYMGVATEDRLDAISAVMRKMDVVETFIQKNGVTFNDLNDIEELSEMGNVIDTMLKGKDYDDLYDFVTHIVPRLNPYSRGESRRELALSDYLTRFGNIDEAFALDANIAGRYFVKNEEDKGIWCKEPGDYIDVKGTSLDILEYWFDAERCKRQVKRVVLVEAWGYKRIPGARGGKGTKLTINGCDKEFTFKEKSISKYKYLYVPFDNSIMVCLV